MKKTRTQMLYTWLLCGLFAALCAVCSQIAIPLPMVPINLALFAVHLAGALLGPVYGAISMVLYMLLGLVGVPVFQGLSGGPAVLFGPTGGYIWGDILAAGIAGFGGRLSGKSWWKLAIWMVGGTLACYLLGTIWFMLTMHTGLGASLMTCVVPFLPGDAVKIALAAWLTIRLRPRLTFHGQG